MQEKKKKKLIITIDGPSGAGKSTAAKLLAEALSYTYIDTGAMYRGVACAYMKGEDHRNLERFLKNLDLRFEFKGKTKVFLDGKDISEDIRDPKVSLLASDLSQNRLVREHLKQQQRALGRKGGVVVEGRDTGSVVFPYADIRFYLDAHPDERAKRRCLELSSKGVSAPLTVVKEEMLRRDKADSEREIAPLIVPEGAVRIDTTDIDPKGVVRILLKFVYQSEI